MSTEFIYRLSIVLSDVAGVVIAYNLFSGFFNDSKRIVKYRMPILMTVMVALISINLFIVKPDYFMMVALVVYILMAALLFEGKLLSKTLIGLFYVVFGVVSELLIAIIASTALGITIEAIGQNEAAMIIGSISSKLVLFSIVKIILRITSKERYQIDFRNWLLLLTIPAISVVMSLFIMNTQFGINSSQGNTFSVLGLLYLNIVAFSLFDSIGNANREAKLVEEKNQQLLIQQERYQERLKSYKEIKRIKHDIHNHLIVIDKMLEDQSSDDARAYIKSIESYVERAADKSVTGNVAIDAIVQNKLTVAEGKGIQTYTDIQVPDQMNIDVLDLSVVLGNAMDNAIEACESVEGELKPSIDLIIKYKQENLLIKIINTVGEKPFKIGEESLFRSTKSGDRGYGLDNINMVIERYKGNLVVEVIGDYFNFSALIPVKS